MLIDMDNLADEQKKAALIEEVTAAFDGVSREDGVTLHEAMVIDNYGSMKDRAEARLKDARCRWQDVPEADIRFSDAVLTFLDSKGYRYYLPAYIVWYLRYIDNEDPDFWSNTFDSIEANLGVGRLRDDNDFLSRIALLTPKQRQGVADFMMFLLERNELSDCDNEDLRQAGDYWKQFLAS